MERIAPYEYIPERGRDVIVPEHKRKSKRTHEEAFENLPVEEVIHEVEDRECPDCGEQMKTVGKEFVRDELVYVPARLFVRKHYAEVVKCPVCGEDESPDACYADVPAPVFKKATPPAPMVRLSPKNIRITLNTYTHVLPEMDIDAAEKLDFIMLKKA